MQHITYTHWLPHIIGRRGMEMLGEYEGYNQNLNPTISNVFATAAYRYQFIFGNFTLNIMVKLVNFVIQSEI